MSRAHQIAAHVLAGTHQVAQRLLVDVGTRTGCNPPIMSKPQQPLGVAPVGLDPVAGRALDLPAPRHTADTRRLQRLRPGAHGGARPVESMAQLVDVFGAQPAGGPRAG